MTDEVGATQLPQDGLVSVEWLAKRIAQEDIIIADCRFQLSDPHAGRRAYEKEHIPGAIFFDLEKDLSGSPADGGGRHPLPPVAQFARVLGDAGIDETVTVVCYDDNDGGMAARLWWMLRWVGHDKVALLDGGYAAWKRAGHPVTDQIPSPTPRGFVPRVRKDMIATMAEVRAIAAGGNGIIVDSRASERYRGEVEPLDPIAGHIPTAINVPWQDNIAADGRFLDADTVTSRFAAVLRRVDTGADAGAGGLIVVHCGSGVTGCVNVFALERAGVAGVKLYVGGWSEWCSLPDNPVAVRDEP